MQLNLNSLVSWFVGTSYVNLRCFCCRKLKKLLTNHYNYVSPHTWGWHIVFACSVRHICFCSITEECLGVGTSYLVCRLVMTSSWPLLILMSEGQRSWWPCEVKSGFRSLTEKRLGRGTPYLVCRLVMVSRRPLRSVCLKSRSQWQWAEKLFLLGPRNFILGVQVGHYQQMTSIDFEITRLKVKVTSIRLVSAQ